MIFWIEFDYELTFLCYNSNIDKYSESYATHQSLLVAYVSYFSRLCLLLAHVPGFYFYSFVCFVRILRINKEVCTCIQYRRWILTHLCKLIR